MDKILHLQGINDYPIYVYRFLMVFVPIPGGWPWDFWTINSIWPEVRIDHRRDLCCRAFVDVPGPGVFWNTRPGEVGGDSLLLITGCILNEIRVTF